MLKQVVIIQILYKTEHFLKEKQKSNWINERWISWTDHGRICLIKSKPYGYLKDNNNEDKKAEDTKKCVIEKKLKFEIL